MSILNFFFPEHYVTDHGVAELRLHKYSGEDHSILSKLFLQRFWNAAIELIPRSVAPNVITTSGLIAMIFAYSLIVYFSPWLTGIAPRWVYGCTAFGLWFYQTMDALDGKQARRTQSGSPLGALFDHGVDSLITSLMFIMTADVLGLGDMENAESGFLPWPWAFLMHLICLVVFFMAAWEEYHTHNLYLGPINGPVEGMVMVECVHFSACLFGPAWLRMPIFHLFGYEISMRVLFVYFFFFGSFPTIFHHVYGTVRYFLHHRNKHSARFTHTPTIELMFTTLVPLGLFVGSICSIFMFTSIGSMALNTAPILVYSYSALFFTLIATRLILCSTTRDAFPSFHPVLASVLTLLFVALTMDSEMFIICLFFSILYELALFVHFAQSVCVQISTALDIYVFSIKPKP